MACTGQIVCATPAVEGDGEEVEYRAAVRVTASAVSVLRPDLLVTAKHVFFNGKSAVVPFGSCSFRSYFAAERSPFRWSSRRTRGRDTCSTTRISSSFASSANWRAATRLRSTTPDSSLPEGEQILSVTGHQLHTLNKISDREPVVAKGNIRRVLDGVLGGPPFYYADFDLDDGGSGGAVFALRMDARFPDDEGRLILRGISVAYGLHAKNGKPYSEERNYTVIIGLEAEFRELVKGKAQKPAAVEPAACAESGAAKINVMSDAVASSQSETLAASLQSAACSRGATPGRKAGKAKANCAALAKD